MRSETNSPPPRALALDVDPLDRAGTRAANGGLFGPLRELAARLFGGRARTRPLVRGAGPAPDDRREPYLIR